MSDVDVAAIREALKNATPGPFEARVDRRLMWTLVTNGDLSDGVIARCADDDEAELIVLLRNNAEALLDAYETQQPKCDPLTVQQAYDRLDLAERDYREALDRDASDWSLQR